MNRRFLAASVVLLTVALAVAAGIVMRCAGRRPSRLDRSAAGSVERVEGAAVSRLQRIPLYRTWLRAERLRSGTLAGDGTLHVEVDLRAAIEPRLAAIGLTGGSDLLPASARGTIVAEGVPARTTAPALRESWSFDGHAGLFDLLDRDPAGSGATVALDAIPGAPTAMVRVRLVPARLADPSLGGAAFASWRDRASFVEKLLGRPLRAEIAEDLAGPAVFALYDTEDDAEAEAVLAVELRRSDRLAGLLDTLFGLAALTERVTVRRYRGVSTGSFHARSGGPGVALAVDGPVLFVATSRARLEAAIDARRALPRPPGVVARGGDPAASWSAVSESAFVAHGWARLARSAVEPRAQDAMTIAALRPEGATGWRLEGHGPGPAISADPVLPFLRSVYGGRQRDGD